MNLQKNLLMMDPDFNIHYKIDNLENDPWGL